MSYSNKNCGSSRRIGNKRLLSCKLSNHRSASALRRVLQEVLKYVIFAVQFM